MSLSNAAFLKEYTRLFYIIQEIYKEYNPPRTKIGDKDFELVQWQREVFKGAWKLVQAKYLFPILQVIAASNGIGFNGIKAALRELNDQTLTTRLNQFQALNLIGRQVTTDTPPGVKYFLTEFGTNFSLLAFPFLLFFRLNRFWEIISLVYKEDPPNLPLSDGTLFPDIKRRFEEFQKIRFGEQESLEQRRGILKSPVREKAIRILFTTLQMSQEFVSRFSKNLEDPVTYARTFEGVTQAIETIQGKFFFDIFFTLYLYSPLSFNDLKNLLPDINSPTLSTRLKEMEQIQVVDRDIISETPLKVSYSLTPFGVGFLSMFWPIIAFLGLYAPNFEFLG